MLYAREIEQRRRDVTVVDVNLLRRSWYFDYLKQAYPQFVARSRREIDQFVAELKQWERNPKAYAASAAMKEQIASVFREMWQALLVNESKVAPIYVTSEMAFVTGRDNEEITRWLVTNYRLLPRGLVLQLSQAREFADP